MNSISTSTRSLNDRSQLAYSLRVQKSNFPQCTLPSYPVLPRVTVSGPVVARVLRLPERHPSNGVLATTHTPAPEPAKHSPTQQHPVRQNYHPRQNRPVSSTDYLLYHLPRTKSETHTLRHTWIRGPQISPSAYSHLLPIVSRQPVSHGTW